MHPSSAEPIIVDHPKPRKPSLLWRITKKLLLLLAVSFGLVVLTSVIIAAFFEEQIGKRLINEINQQLKTELRVTSYDLSLLSGFPKVSADLKGVILDDAMKGTLLEAKKVSFRMGLLSLLSDNIKVHSVLIEDGALFIHIDRKGNFNYNILKATDQDSPDKPKESSDLAISIDEAILQDVELIYIDDRASQQVRVMVEEVTASGQFSSEAFSMKSVGQLKTDFVEMKDGRYLVGKNVTYDTRMNVDLVNRKYEFEEMNLGIQSNFFNLTGFIASEGGATNFDLEVVTKDGNIESVIDFLPEQHLAYFGDFTSNGKFDLKAAVKGKLDEKSYPAINVAFGLSDGKVSSPRLENSLKDVNFTGFFTNGKYQNNKTSKFLIKDFTAHLNRQLVESNFTLYNFDDPAIDLQLSGVIPLGDVYELFNIKTITGAGGEVEVDDLLIKGRVADMFNQSRISKVKTGGAITFDDASLNFGRKTILVDRGTVQLVSNSLVVEDIRIEAPDTEMKVEGKFANILPFLLADSLNSGKAELVFQANLNASKVDLDQLLALNEPEFTTKGIQPRSVIVKKKSDDIRKRERFTKLLKGTFKARIDQFNYKEIETQNFRGTLEFANNELRIEGNVEAMDGAAKIKGKMFFEEKPYLKAEVEMAGIDVKEFFRQFENFGQTVVKSEHLKGALQSQMLVNAYWSEEGQFLYDKLNVLGVVNITDGELVNFAMLYDFSDYVKIQDLKHIRFENMQNWMEVRGSKVYIPVMFVQSNAMNLTMSGEHTFDNQIDYNLKINAGQVLVNKFKKYNRDMDPQRADRNGWFNLYYRIYGTTADYKVVQDKRAVKRAFANSEHHKREIRTTLLREFGKVDEDVEAATAWINSQKDEGDADEKAEYLDPAKIEQPKPIENPTPPAIDEGEDEYLDFEEEGGSAGGEDEYFDWEVEGGGGN